MFNFVFNSEGDYGRYDRLPTSKRGLTKLPELRAMAFPVCRHPAVMEIIVVMTARMKMKTTMKRRRMTMDHRCVSSRKKTDVDVSVLPYHVV